MSIELKDMPNGHATSPVLPPAPRGLDPLLLQTIQEAMANATTQAVGSANALAQKLIHDQMLAVERRLSAIDAPKAQVLAVEVNGHFSKLKSPAVPYLGRLIINAKLGLNTLLVGPAGCGKTFAAHQLAEALERKFGHVCFTAGASETWLFGRQTPNGFVPGTYYTLYKEGGVFLADEFDAADANMLLSLNTSLANGSMYNPINGENVTRHPDFVFIAGANTVGKGGDAVYTGRNRLDGATLNRMVCIAVDYNPEIEKMLCPDATLFGVLSDARKKLRDLKSDEILSSRSFEIAFKQLSAGIDPNDILASLTMGWPDEIRTSCGLDRYPKSQPDKKALPAPREPDSVEPAESPMEKAVEAVKKASRERDSRESMPAPSPAMTSAEAKISENEARIAELKRRLAMGS